MPNIQLQTGKTIYISCYDYYFGIDENDLHEFYQSCIADDLGSFVENPFNNSPVDAGKIQIEEISDITIIEDLSDDL